MRQISSKPSNDERYTWPADENGSEVAHPTVKPVTLMRWLIRLVCPVGGTVLDPFCGSGSTLRAAILEGRNAIGLDLDTDGHYLPLARAKILGADSVSAEGRPVFDNPRLPGLESA